ncbi:MAG: Ig-like domain-containing protein [Chitinophagaceae bacterium]
MKTFLLFFSALLSLATVRGQYTQNFEGSENSLTGNCWVMNGTFRTTDADKVIAGSASIIANPPSNGPVKFISTPALNIMATGLAVSFKYKLTNPIDGNSTRTIEVGLLDNTGAFTSLDIQTLDRFSSTAVQTFNQTFNPGFNSSGKLVIRFGGTPGEGNSRVVIDDMATNANPKYGSGTCNSAPVAANDIFSGPRGTIISGNLISNDTEPNGEAMTPAVVIPSADGVLDLKNDGSFTFTPAPGFTGSQTTFTYQLQDNGTDPLSSNIANVTLNFFTNGTLPVKLTGFIAKYQKPDVLLNWSTAQEKNFSHFELEQSTDGVNYKSIALVFGIGESDRRVDYSYTDKNLAGRSGLIYYRLKSVDIDNQFTYSAIQIIRLGGENETLSLITYPNPVINSVRITVPASWQNKKVTYEVLGLGGQVTVRMERANSGQTETIDLGNFARGIYIVRVHCEGSVVQQKIIRQ